jgi:threonine dehydratase
MEYVGKVARRTPLKQSSTLNRWTGADVYLKLENLQKTGSFKLRGAWNKIRTLSEVEVVRGIVAASAGNHAQGVAYAATSRGLKATIYMPLNTPSSKIDATKSYGANIALVGESYQEAYEAAKGEQQVKGATFVHAFDDPLVMAGQGTVAMEIMQQCADLDTILVPVGGGGLIAGTAIAVKELQPHVEVIGIQSAGAPSSYNRFKGKGNRKIVSVHSIADGISVKEPGTLTYPIIHRYVDDMMTVTDEEIAFSIVFMLEREKMLVEGAGAASLAALLCKSHRFQGKKVGIIISGGNTDIEKLTMFKNLANKVEPTRKYG